MAITASFIAAANTLNIQGDDAANGITVSRDAAGTLLVNNGAVAIAGGPATVANTALIQAFGLGGADVITFDQANGALPAGKLFGGFGDDTLTGGAGGDELRGEGDNDILSGQGGSDLLFGGDQDDTLTGGDGDDQMFGEGGNDRMIWNPGDDSDLVEGGDGSDTAEVNGGNGAEQFTVTANGTRVRFDRLDPAPFALDIGTTESLVVNMNGGDDRFSAAGNLAALIGITVDGGAGNDTILGSNGSDLLLGGGDNDFIDGQQGSDTALLGAGDDTFQWDPGDGSDVVEGQDGADTLVFNGSAGAEIMNIAANGERALLTRNLGNIVMDLDGLETLRINALGSIDTIVINDLSATDVTSIALDLRTAGAGDAQADVVSVAGGALGETIDVIFAGGVAQVLGLPYFFEMQGVEAIDRLTVAGSGGNDTLNAATLPAGALLLTLDGGTGDDTLSSGLGDDLLIGGIGNDTYVVNGALDVMVENPGAGIDTVVTSLNTATLDVNFENLSFNGSGNFIGTGNAVANIMRGGAGADQLSGLDGDDTLDGGAEADQLFGGIGGDKASYLSATGGVTADLGAPGNNTGDALGDSYDAIEHLGGSNSADTLRGNGGFNTLEGLDGADRLEGQAGSDRLVGGAGGDILDGGTSTDTADYIGSTAGIVIKLSQNTATGGDATGDTLIGIENLTGSDFADTLSGNASDNLLNGRLGNDVLVGGGGNDRLFGSSGQDVVNGGTGRDELSGGGDSDRFDFAALADSAVGPNRDAILDFTVDPAAGAGFIDRINVSSIDAQAAAAGNQAFGFIGASQFSAEGQIRAIQVGADTVVQFNTAGADGAEMEVLLRNFTAANLEAADFIL
jgi:Ca2+-binding RTX toxin-like protein